MAGPSPDDSNALSLATAQRIVEQIDAAHTVAQLTLLGNGVKSDVWLARCETGEEFALKIFNDKYPGAPDRELAFYRAIGDDPALPIPRLLAEGAPTDDLPGFVVLTVLRGERLSESITDISDDDVLSVYRQLGSFLRALHEHPEPGFGVLPLTADPATLPRNVAFMEDRFAGSLSSYVSLGGNRYLASRIATFVAERSALFADCDAPVVCQGDLHEANVLVQREDGLRVTGIVDFELALAADPLMDLAQTHHAARRGSDASLAAMIDGYGELPPRWRERFELYYLYFALELWHYYAASETSQRKPRRELDAKIAAIVGASRRRMLRSRIRSAFN